MTVPSGPVRGHLDGAARSDGDLPDQGQADAEAPLAL